MILTVYNNAVLQPVFFIFLEIKIFLPLQISLSCDMNSYAFSRIHQNVIYGLPFLVVEIIQVKYYYINYN